MKTQISNALKYLCLNSFVSLAALICVTGCAGFVHHSDPLAGWEQIHRDKLDDTIVKDYKVFIQTLPEKERTLVEDYSIWVYQNRTGDKAVKIEIPLSGKILDHILIYDQNSKRIKTIKYIAGYYSQW